MLLIVNFYSYLKKEITLILHKISEKRIEGDLYFYEADRTMNPKSCQEESR